jgi:hypothetical protein
VNYSERQLKNLSVSHLSNRKNEGEPYGFSQSGVQLIRTFTNSNFTNMTITKGSSYIVFWSRLSKWLSVVNTATNEHFSIRCAHFFDTVEASRASFDKLLCFSKLDGRAVVTVVNVKIRSTYQIHVRKRQIMDFFEVSDQQADANLITSNSDFDAKFYGRTDNVIVMVNGCALFFTNKAYERDYLESQVTRMHYELNNVISMREKLNKSVG